MFEDENEKKVNVPDDITNENESADIPAEFQTSPTDFSVPTASDITAQIPGTAAEPAAPAAPAEQPAAPESAEAYTASEPAEPAAPDFSSHSEPQAPVNNAGVYEPAGFNPATGAYQQPQAPVYAENPYSPYSDRQYVNNNNYSQPGTPAFNPPIQNGGFNRPPKKKKAGRIILAVVAVILVFIIGFASAALLLKKSANYRVVSSDDDNESTTSYSASGSGDDTELEIASTPSGDETSTAKIAEKGRASNVGILIYTNSSSTSASGEGSGVVMGLDSTKKYTYIITCAHVIDTAGATIKVETEDGTTYDAEVVGYDTRTDLGVVKVNKTGFTAAEFGDSSKLSVGDPVYAVGNPGGVEFFGTFTAGYVSAINRPISSEIGYTMNCIQHDAAINPGNSGGMLLNKYGQVIGINSQKITSTSYEGMGFAIPITEAKEIIDDLITYGYVPDRAKLGITYAAATNASTSYAIIAQANNLPAGTLVITSINSDSAFTGTEVREGDMITKVNGKDLDTADVLLETIDNGKVGDEITLTIARMNSNYKVETFEVTVKLVEDRGDTVEEQTTQQSYNPYSYFGF